MQGSRLIGLKRRPEPAARSLRTVKGTQLRCCAPSHSLDTTGSCLEDERRHAIGCIDDSSSPLQPLDGAQDGGERV